VDATAEFFNGLAARAQDPALRKATGTVRFDVEDDGATETWFVAFDRGNVSVARDGLAGDCSVRAPRDVFEGMVAGRINPFAAVLRGTLAVEGDPQLLVRAQRLITTGTGRKS
jgi:putative sterol carrier protein